MATITESSIELTQFECNHNVSAGKDESNPINDPNELTAQPLPPVDGGWQAWTFLAACFALEAIVWGLPFSFGIFQTYYQNSPIFSSTERSSIASIGTTTIGVSYFSSPFIGITMQRFPWTRRYAMLLGLTIMAVALISASYCTTVSGLIATQGVLYGIGSITLYYPSNLFLDEWFLARKGLAFGIMFSGTGAAGVAVPFIIQWLLDTYGFRPALRIWTVVMVLLTLPCLHFIRPRLPPSQTSALRPRDLNFLKHKLFWLFQFGNVIQSLGVFIPSLWLPSFARSLNLPAFAGPLSLAFYNGAYSIGVILGGYLADRCHVSVAILTASLGGVVASFVFWGLASTQPMLYTFAWLWGMFAGMYNGTWTGCAAAMKPLVPNGTIDTGIFVGLMAAGKGIGGVVSGPLSERLLGVGWQTGADFIYGSSYGVLVVFCGICAALGGSACVGRVVKMF